MSTTINIKLNKPASQFQAGDSTGFGIKGGVKYYDRETRKDEWTNYECAIFSKADAQIKYLAETLIEGAVVTVTGKTIKVRTYETQNGSGITLVLNDAYIEYIASPAIVRDPQAAQARLNEKPKTIAQQKAQQPTSQDWLDDDLSF